MSDDVEFRNLTAYLMYPDGDAAAQWLTRMLGFQPGRIARDEQGRWREGEIAVGPTHFDISGGAAPDAASGAGGIFIVHISDVDAQYRRIVAAGEEIDPPKDEQYGPRTCHITDPWGYQWYFWQGDAVYPAQ